MKLDLLVYGLIAAIVVGAGFFIAKDLLTGPGVGDCVAPQANSATLDLHELKCTSHQAMFEVAAIGADCPAGDYLMTSDGDEKTCFVLDVGKNMCVKPQQYEDRSEAVDVQTSGACRGGDLKEVTEVIDGTFDKSRCKKPELSLAYSKPARTICMDKL